MYKLSTVHYQLSTFIDTQKASAHAYAEAETIFLFVGTIFMETRLFQMDILRAPVGQNRRPVVVR